MTSKLSVLVQVDVGGHHVAIKVIGALTVVSQQGLHSLIRRAGGWTSGIGVPVDLNGLSLAEAEGVRLLHDVLADPELTGRGGVVHVVPPVTVGTTPAPRADGLDGVAGSAGPAGGVGHSRPGWSSTPAGMLVA